MAETEQSPLEFILREMVAVHNAGLYYAAITIALTLPDICSKLSYDVSDDRYWKGNQKRYEQWCKLYLADKERLPYLTPQDMWALRGGMVHQGQTFGHPKSRFERVVFVLPDAGGNQFQIGEGHFGGDKPLSAISTSTFCQAILEGVRDFIVSTQDDAIVQKNIVGLVRLRPEGDGRLFSGLAVIT